MVLRDRRDDFGLARLHAGGGQFVFLHEDLQPREHAARFLARVLAEALEFVAGEDGALHGGADVLGDTR